METPPPAFAHKNPLDKVPVEILGEIFIHCLLAATHRPQANTAPLLLCQVSRQWRHVAVELPSLWSTVTIECYWHGCRMNERLFNIWLERSGDVPLSISVEVKIGEAYSEDLPGLSKIIQIIIRQMHRWKSLRLVGFFPHSTREHFKDLPSAGAPLLQEATIQIQTSSDTPRDLAFLFHNSPLLHSLTWQFGLYSRLPLFSSLHWCRLSSIHFECLLSVADCYAILSRSPNLQSCYFENVSVIAPDLCQLSTPHITLAALQSFRIEASIDILSLLRTVTFPVLSCLMIEWTGLHHRAFVNVASEIPDLLCRSNSPPLQKLVLENFGVEETELIQCLALAPRLEILDVCDESTRKPNLTDEVIHALEVRSERDDVTVLCPALEIIKLKGRVQSTDGQFMKMIRQRWKEAAVVNGVASLKEVHVEFGSTRQRHELDFTGLGQLRSDGLLARAFSH